MKKDGKVKKDLSKQAYGKLVRKKFLDNLKDEWGAYQPIRDYLYRFSNGNKVVTLYSSFTRSRWWWGVSKNYWSKWDKNTYMALLMRDAKKCEYLLMSPKDSATLLRKIKEDKQGKKHIVIYFPSTGKRYLQQWQSYQVDKKIVFLCNLDVEKSLKNIDKNTIKRKVFKKYDPIARVEAYFQTLTPQEKERFLDEIKRGSRV